MIVKKEYYSFNEKENVVVRSFTILKDGKEIAGGFVGISGEELLQIHETAPELAAKDCRLEGLLNREPEDEQEAEPTEMEQLQADIAYIKMKMKGM